VLDPAGYGALTISKSISIQGHGFAGLAVPSGTGIATATAGVVVNLRGLLLDGVGTGGMGLTFTASGAVLNIQDSVIRNFTNYGIYFAPSSGTSKLSISGTLVSDNSNGIGIAPTGSGSALAVVSHVEIDHSQSEAIVAYSADTSGAVWVDVSDSVAAHNGHTGIRAETLGTGGPTTVMVRNSTFANNNVALQVDGTFVVLRVGGSTITNNDVGFATLSGGTLYSYGDNNLDGNTADGAATAVIPRQ